MNIMPGVAIENIPDTDPEPNPNPDPTPDPDPKPDPEPQDLTQKFRAWLGYWDMELDTWAYGLEGKELVGHQDSLTVGAENRAFLLDVEDTSSIHYAYYHDFLGGSMEYSVDLRDVECACAAGVYLVGTDYQECGWDSQEPGATPACPRVEVMEANKDAFKVATHPCLFGQCEPDSPTTEYLNGYGSGPNFTINSDKPFHVKTRFYSSEESIDGTDYLSLQYIETTLTQDGKNITAIQDDADTLFAVSTWLDKWMATVISNFDNGLQNDLSGQCNADCSKNYNTKYTAFRFNSKDSIGDDSNDGDQDGDGDEGELVVEGVAPSIDMCSDNRNCSACHMAHMSNKPDDKFPVCTEERSFRYTNECTKKW
jgi:hypothetical protein